MTTSFVVPPAWLQLCDFIFPGIYGAETSCARICGHDGDHDGIYHANAVAADIRAALATVPRPATQPEGLLIKTCGWGCGTGHTTDECPNWSRDNMPPHLTTPSQPARGEALTVAVQAEREAVMDEINDLCPHEPDEHPEGCCDVCDFASVVGGVLDEHFDRLAAQPVHGDNEAALRARPNSPAEQALRDAADDARAMHDPPTPDCVEWADWLDARADRIALAYWGGER